MFLKALEISFRRFLPLRELNDIEQYAAGTSTCYIYINFISAFKETKIQEDNAPTFITLCCLI